MYYIFIIIITFILSNLVLEVLFIAKSCLIFRIIILKLFFPVITLLLYMISKPIVKFFINKTLFSIFKCLWPKWKTKSKYIRYIKYILGHIRYLFMQIMHRSILSILTIRKKHLIIDFFIIIRLTIISYSNSFMHHLIIDN